jgi:hypothetical protein
MADGGFGRMVLPFVFMLVFFFAVMLLLGSIFTGLIGGIAIAAVATGVMVGVLYYKFDRMRRGTVVRFSEYGVELSDKLGFHVTLAWRDITRIGQVNTQMANPGAIESGDVSVSVGAIRSQGVIGWGYRSVPPRAPGWMRENLANQPRSPVDGRPLVAIPLGGIDPNWLHGPMAQWIRLYRPDLLGGAQPQAHPGYYQ